MRNNQEMKINIMKINKKKTEIKIKQGILSEMGTMWTNVAMAAFPERNNLKTEGKI